MVFEDTVSIAAPQADVWEVLLDVNSLAACMPGVEHITQIDESTFDGVIEAAVGPISGKFSYRAHIVDAQPPDELTAELNGTDSVTKSKVHADMRMRLRPLEPRQTELSYTATVKITGRLAILGDMMLRSTATLMLEEFTRRLRRQLETRPLEDNVAGAI